MKTRFALATLLVAGIGTILMARTAERATFILTNGERVSGTVVFHTSEQSNLRQDTNEWSLGKAEGGEIAIKGHQIAVIDFVGGTPSQAELDATRPGEQMLAMRDGSTRRGKIVDMLRGDTVRWERTDGDRENFPINSVRRVYMNVESARTIFNYTPTAAASPSTKPSLNLTVPAGSGTAVLANTAWTDTGVTVRSGQMVRFAVTGKAGFGLDQEMVAGPGGNDKFKSNSYPVAGLPVGALIGKVGNSGQPFAIGDATGTIRMPATGRLLLGINDDNLGDNSGGFRVDIIR